MKAVFQPGGTKENHEKPSQDTRYQSRVQNRRLPENDTGVLTTRLRSLVKNTLKCCFMSTENFILLQVHYRLPKTCRYNSAVCTNISIFFTSYFTSRDSILMINCLCYFVYEDTSYATVIRSSSVLKTFFFSSS